MSARLPPRSTYSSWDWTSTYTEGPVVAPDGTLRVVLGSPASATAVLYSLSAQGEVLWQTDLCDDYQQSGGDPLVVAVDGTTVVRTFPNVVGVDGVGTILWKLPVYPNGAYSAAIDPDGMLVVLADGIWGIDAATGEQRWQVSGPGIDGGVLYFSSAMVLGAARSVVGQTHGGAVFLARDP